MTEKRKYEKPSTRVIGLQQRQQLLTGSPFNGDRGNPYGDPTDPWSESPASPFNNLPGLDVLNILPE